MGSGCLRETEACTQRQALAAEIDALHTESQRASGDTAKLKSLVPELTRLEQRHESLPPVGQDCPYEFWGGPLTQRLNEVRASLGEPTLEEIRQQQDEARQAALRAPRLLAIQKELAKPAQPWEPDKFRGVPWGATMQEAQTILKAAGDEFCVSDRYAMLGSCSVFSAKIGPALVSIDFQFGKTNTFERAILSFSQEAYSDLRGAFVDRYGPPTTTKKETLRNRMGATFANEILLWAGNRVWITLHHYGSSVDQGHAVVTLKSVIDRDREEAEKARKKGKDDL